MRGHIYYQVEESHMTEDGVRVIDKVKVLAVDTGDGTMPPRIEEKSQAEVLLILRAAIDTAINTPTIETESNAIQVATRYPRALAGGKLRANLGQERWDWLNQRGVPMSFGVTEPDVIK